MNETRLKGNFTGGRIPYGYKKDGKKLIINEERAEVIRYIFNQYAMGVYVKDILFELHRRGLHTRENGSEKALSITFSRTKNMRAFITYTDRRTTTCSRKSFRRKPLKKYARK